MHVYKHPEMHGYTDLMFSSLGLAAGINGDRFGVFICELYTSGSESSLSSDMTASA